VAKTKTVTSVGRNSNLTVASVVARPVTVFSSASDKLLRLHRLSKND
jgi:hypothetical protein